MTRPLLLAAVLGTVLALPHAGAQPLSGLPGGMVWELRSLEENGQTTRFSPDPANPSVQFGDKTATGNAGCNTYRAEVVSRGTALHFSRPVTTRMACPEDRMALESRFLRLLGGTTRFTRSGSVLTLSTGGQARLTFRQRSGAKPLQPAAPGAVQPDLAAQIEGSWQLLTLNNEILSSRSQVSLKFVAGRLGGSDGCNSFGGSGRLDGATLLATSPLLSTRMACQSGDRVPSLPALLQHGAAVQVSDDTLTLTGDGNTWVFGRSGATSPAAPTSGQPAPALPSASTTFEAATAQLGPDEDLFIVGPQLVACPGAAVPGCLLVKHPGETAWSVFPGTFEGYTFQPGTVQLLQVRVERLARPVPSGSTVRYRLVRVLGTQLGR